MHYHPHRDLPPFTMSRYGHLIHDEEEALAERMERLAPNSDRPPSPIVSIGGR